MARRVLILMAVYNGSQYIREQLDSLINQTYENWKLLIRDDGSTDETVNIINEYLTDARIQLIKNTTSIYGANANFKSLILAGGVFDYYMFCDQDDIWDSNKVEKMIEEAEKNENSASPIIVHANFRVINGTGDVITNDLNAEYNMQVKHPLVDAFFSHRIMGCNMLINQEMFNLLKSIMDDSECHNLGHDTLCSKVCAAYNGKMVYINDILMSYRRHGNNVTAAHQYKITIRRVFNRLLGFDNLCRDLSYLYWCSIQSAYLLLKHADMPNREALQCIESTLKQGGFSGISIWIRYHIDCGTPIRTFSHLLVLITGRYKKYFKYDLPN